MTSTTQPSTAEDIVDKVGGPGNILGLTHCATRLRFELKDASQIDQTAVESIKGVMGAVPQSGDRYQVVIGGAVQSTFQDIMNLPSMAGVGKGVTDIEQASFGWRTAFTEFINAVPSRARPYYPHRPPRAMHPAYQAPRRRVDQRHYPPD